MSSSVKFVNFFRVAGLDFYDANWQNYEALYLSEEERKVKPAQGYISANVIAAKKPEHFMHLLFKDRFFSTSQISTVRKMKPITALLLTRSQARC